LHEATVNRRKLMPAYIVSLPSGVSFGNKNTDVVVFAENATYARDMAKAAYNQGSDSAWDLATVTEIAVGADFAGWTMRVRIDYAAAQSTPIDHSIVGAAADTIDNLGTDMATELNTNALIAAAAWDGLTNILTCAAVGDGLGDGRLLVDLIPPGDNRGPVASYVGTITDGGIAAAALTVQMATDAIAIAAIHGELPNRV
jgi:hypothetical protein